MLNSLDLNKRQKRLIQDVIDEACKTGVSPVWSSLLQSQVHVRVPAMSNDAYVHV
jgi:hypothetical protein